MYELFDPKNPNVMGVGTTSICNGCGKEVLDYDEIKHYSECTISQIRVGLDKKTCGKSKFTKVRK